MIRGFEDVTYSITEQEQLLIPEIIEILCQRKGKENSITCKQIIVLMGYSITDPRLRKCIKYIQVNKLLNWVVATSQGFYFTETVADVIDQIESLKNRESALAFVRQSLENSLQNLN